MGTSEVTSQYRLNKWMEIIRQCRSSGQTIAVWCNENHINPSSYYYWLRKIRHAASESLPSLHENNSIVPLNIPEEDPVKVGSSDQETSSDLVLCLGTVKLEIRNTASASLIENTLRALQHVR